MNFLDLEYFLAAADEMNFTRAAEKLFITQQALSGRIAKLEHHYGVELFDRNAPLSLTESGVCLVKNARCLLRQKQQTDLELQDIKNFENGILTIGVHNDRGTVTLPEILARFREDWPDVRLQIFESTPAKIMEALGSGYADLTIGFPIEQEEIRSVTLYRETFVVVVPLSILNAHFTPEEQERMLHADMLPIEVFCGCPFLAYSQSTWLKQIFEDCCNQAGIKPQIVMETSNFMTRIAMCFAGLGIMFAAGSFLHHSTHLLDPQQLERVRTFKIDCLDFNKDISINYLKKKYQSKASLEFLRVAKEVFASAPPAV